MRLKLALFFLCTLPALADPQLALSDGEAFTYKVSWAVVMGAGEIKISAQHETADSAPRLRVTTTTATRGFARWLLKFDAKAESIFDARTGRLASLTESNQQGSKHAEHSVVFDYAKKQALYSAPGLDQPRALEMPPGDPVDLITSLLQTRTWDLKPGEQRDALVLFDDEFYELTLHAVRTEEIYTPLGRFNTIVLEPRMEKTPPKGMFKKGSTVRVWIEQDDARRLPVRFEVEFNIGTGVANLSGYRPPTSANPAEASPTPPVTEAKPAAPDAKNPGP